ncbi:MAG: hypothetical protein FJ125_00360 [Deltaproteobacteria bacterium]|nr:hypothetical protein [Deltaproteobacteria bacterium]
MHHLRRACSFSQPQPHLRPHHLLRPHRHLPLLLLPALLPWAGCSAEEEPARTPAPQCRVEGDCPADQYCLLGTCVPRGGEADGARPGEDGGPPADGSLPDPDGGGAAEDGGLACQPACPGRQVCDPASGRCLEAVPCAGPEDCRAGRICLDGACGDPCDAASCPVGQVCDGASGRCGTPPPCPAEGSCPGEGWQCLAGSCYPPCTQGGCPSPGQRCDVETQRCTEPEPCAADGDCLGERICHNRACSDPPPRCGDDGDCPGNQVCSPGGRCEPPARCTTDVQCVPLLCDEERERCEACVVDADRPGRQGCRRGDGDERNRCTEPARCEGDADCLGLRICEENQCVPPPQCADDPRQGNDSAEHAAALEPGVHPGLVRCDRQDDWFALQLQQG